MTLVELYIGFMTAVIATTLITMIWYFTKVWIRDGYLGKNKIFEIHEVKTFYLHVAGFIALLILEVMAFGSTIDSPGIQQASNESWLVIGTLTGGIFVGEIVADVRKAFKNPHPPSHDKT